MKGVFEMIKQISFDKALDYIHDGMTIMVGGFLGIGTPQALIDACIEKNIQIMWLANGL